MRILLIEDDPQLGDAARVGLAQDLYAVDWAESAEEALLALRTQQYAAVLLDLGLPGITGIELLAQLRRSGNPVPVIVITARAERAGKIAALDLGADDYMVKPFDLDELAARLRAVVRRSAGCAQAALRHGPLEIDTARRAVRVAGKAIVLTRHEYTLLCELTRQPGIVMSRARLEDSLYGWGEEIGSNAVEVHIHHLRRKLGVDLIRTVRGVGYKVE